MSPDPEAKNGGRVALNGWMVIRDEGQCERQKLSFVLFLLDHAVESPALNISNGSLPPTNTFHKSRRGQFSEH
jgi:hypothetical protein